MRPQAKVKRQLYKPLGFLCLALGGLGLVLPVLPTTPLVLLAAWFFAQSSEKWHRKLLASELFGPLIRNWEQHRCIPLRTKIVAISAMLVAGSASITFAMESPALRIATGLLMAIGALTLLSIKTCPGAKDSQSQESTPR